jgi:hypothetical protein
MAKARASSIKGRQKPTSKSNLPLFLMLGGGLILIIIALFAFLDRPAPFTPQLNGGPSIKADKDKVDLGDMKLGANTAQVSFEITNVGDQPLRFSKAPYVEVKEGC